MLALERRNRIEQIILQNRSVLVAELAKQFNVSAETIRGDLEKLERQGVLIRTYGGATLADSIDPEPAAEERQTLNYESKQKIGRRAAEMIEDGETVFLDASTSALHLARSIKIKRGITVITNSISVTEELSSCNHINVICVGGQLTPRNMSFVGRVSEELIRRHYVANKFFFSCRGVTADRGLMDSTEGEAEIKKAMMERSEQCVFLCDEAKLTQAGMQVICAIGRIDRMVTDADAVKTREFKKAGVDVILV